MITLFDCVIAYDHCVDAALWYVVEFVNFNKLLFKSPGRWLE
jgi:hypothetical protein